MKTPETSRCDKLQTTADAREWASEAEKAKNWVSESGAVRAAERTGVDKGGPGGPAPPPMAGQKRTFLLK